MSDVPEQMPETGQDDPSYNIRMQIQEAIGKTNSPSVKATLADCETAVLLLVEANRQLEQTRRDLAKMRAEAWTENKVRQAVTQTWSNAIQAIISHGEDY